MNYDTLFPKYYRNYQKLSGMQTISLILKENKTCKKCIHSKASDTLGLQYDSQNYCFLTIDKARLRIQTLFIHLLNTTAYNNGTILYCCKCR